MNTPRLETLRHLLSTETSFQARARALAGSIHQSRLDLSDVRTSYALAEDYGGKLRVIGVVTLEELDEAEAWMLGRADAVDVKKARDVLGQLLPVVLQRGETR